MKSNHRFPQRSTQPLHYSFLSWKKFTVPVDAAGQLPAEPSACYGHTFDILATYIIPLFHPAQIYISTFSFYLSQTLQ